VLCREVSVWVWSDELVDRFPAMGTQENVNVPLIAYAVEGETDLEMLARDVLAAPLRDPAGRGSLNHSEAAAER